MNLDNIIIKIANSNDANGLHRCMNQAYLAYSSMLGGLRLPPMDVDYSEEIRLYPVWVALKRNEIVGGLIMVFDRDKASVANVAVSPKAQGLGIGRKLMNFAEKEARDRGYSELNLATHVLLEDNVSLYKHLGWKVTSCDETHIYMEKCIT